MPFRFVHTADIHLDSPLRSLALRDPALAELIGTATRDAFIRTIELCLAEQVDALLLSGDLYDGEQTSMKTARFLAEQVRRLHEAGIRVFVIRGNHDALSRITKELTFPDSVKVFGGRADAVAIARPGLGFPVAVHGLSFARPQAPESLLRHYKPPVADAVNIALMHTSLAGSPGHDDYAPCALGDLHAAGFDYWALGHIHKRSEDRARSAVVMPGMPQGRDIGESGPKSVALATVADDRSIHIEQRLTSIAQFETVEVDVGGIADWRDLLSAVTAGLQQAREQTPSAHLVARLRLAGQTPLAWRMRGDRDLLLQDIANRALDIGKTWIEKIELACAAPDPGATATPDPVSELRRLIAQDMLPSDAYRRNIAAIAEELRGQLPAECRAMLGKDEKDFQQALATLMAEGAEDVLARLHAGPGADAA